ncbi:hypothetical protein GQ457_07G000160 [Hibiscus cannabinus]
MKRQGTTHSSRAGLSRVRGPIRSTSDRRFKSNFWLATSWAQGLQSAASPVVVLDRSDRVFIIWSKRIRTFACRYQKPMPYHLAILHTACFGRKKAASGSSLSRAAGRRTTTASCSRLPRLGSRSNRNLYALVGFRLNLIAYLSGANKRKSLSMGSSSDAELIS